MKLKVPKNLVFTEEDIGLEKIVLLKLCQKDYLFLEYEGEIYKWAIQTQQLRRYYPHFLRIDAQTYENRRYLKIVYQGKKQVVEGNYDVSTFEIFQSIDKKKSEWFPISYDLTDIYIISPGLYSVQMPTRIGKGTCGGCDDIVHTMKLRDMMRANYYPDICRSKSRGNRKIRIKLNNLFNRVKNPSLEQVVACYDEQFAKEEEKKLLIRKTAEMLRENNIQLHDLQKYMR